MAPVSGPLVCRLRQTRRLCRLFAETPAPRRAPKVNGFCRRVWRVWQTPRCESVLRPRDAQVVLALRGCAREARVATGRIRGEVPYSLPVSGYVARSLMVYNWSQNSECGIRGWLYETGGPMSLQEDPPLKSSTTLRSASMQLEETLDQAIAMLQRQGRVT